MAASIAGVFWQAVSLIRECRGRCLPGGARVCSRAAILKYLVAANDYDELRIWEIVILLLTGLASSAENMVHRVAGSMHGLYIFPRRRRAGG